MKPNFAASSNGAPAGDSTAACDSRDGRNDPHDTGHVARLLLAALTVYKRLISPHFSGSCRFLPSCADYARQAIVAHGAARGVWLAARRLGRCHPLCAAGYDPVPPVRSSGR